MSDYKFKYLKYKNKFNKLNKLLKQDLSANIKDYGIPNLKGVDIPREEKWFNKIVTLLDKKGTNFWLDIDGNTISKGSDPATAQKKVVRKLKKDPEKYKNLIHIEVMYFGDKLKFKEDGDGPVVVIITVQNGIVQGNGKHISIERQDNKTSRIKFHYSSKNLNKFKLSELKQFALALLNNKEEFSVYKSIDYKTMKKSLIN